MQIKKYKRFLIPGALFFGFTTDMLMFRNINLYYYFSILLFYLIVSFLGIVVINARKAPPFLKTIAPFIVYYAFGALFSAFVVFYSHGGSLWVSWPFIVFLVFLMIGNEFLRKYYIHPLLQISVYFFVLFSYANLAASYLLNKISPASFVLSGVFSVLITFLLFLPLYIKIPKIKKNKNKLVLSIGVIFVSMNLFYFTGLIPPVPLSLKNIGIYYHVQRVSGGEYRVVESKKEKLLDRIFPSSTYQVHPDYNRVYAFSSIFAPEKMSLDIFNEWQYLDSGEWITFAEASYPLTGGRKEGYRGYSYISNPFPGKWKVLVKTSAGQVIGRKNFTVKTEEAPELKTTFK